MSYKDNKFYKALEANCHSEIQNGKAIVETYFENSVGVGDHSSFMEDIKKGMEMINRAEETLVNLKKHFE